MLLAEEHLTVVDICWLSGVPLSTVRASIRTLEHFGWVEGSESTRGRWRYYYVPKHKRYEIEQSVI
jgi:DNA-binding IclR family transcriptional regulator